MKFSVNIVFDYVMPTRIDAFKRCKHAIFTQKQGLFMITTLDSKVTHSMISARIWKYDSLNKEGARKRMIRNYEGDRGLYFINYTCDFLYNWEHISSNHKTTKKEMERSLLTELEWVLILFYQQQDLLVFWEESIT